jgi:hypothetical protein
MSMTAESFWSGDRGWMPGIPGFQPEYFSINATRNGHGFCFGSTTTIVDCHLRLLSLSSYPGLTRETPSKSTRRATLL